MIAKVVHDDLNGGGGSEYLAVSTISLLNEMGFEVDLASFKSPNIDELKNDFGNLKLSIKNVKLIDIFSLLRIDGEGFNQTGGGQQNQQQMLLLYEDNAYDLVINTHGDLLPYYSDNNKHNYNTRSKSNFITYCHFPLVPQLIKNVDYAQFIAKWITNTSTNIAANKDLMDKLFTNALKMYNIMIEKGVVLTNSHFSKNAIKSQYKNVNPIVIYPPANVEKFRDAALNSNERENSILVLSRFSPDKEVENAIKIADIMKKKEIDAKMTLAGNISAENHQYLNNLEQMIEDKGLMDRVHIKVNVSFSHLLDLMKQSKVLLHPLAGEPFGIAIVEAMSAGLIPVVPDVGCNTEFVPSQYHFHTFEEAASIIKHALLLSSKNSERIRMSKIA